MEVLIVAEKEELCAEITPLRWVVASVRVTTTHLKDVIVQQATIRVSRML